MYNQQWPWLASVILKISSLAILYSFLPISYALAENKIEPAPSPSAQLQVGNEAGVDIVCQSDVYFRWQKHPKTRKDEKGQTIQEEAPPPEDVFFSTVSKSGLSESDVRQQLQAPLSAEKGESINHCRLLHNDQAHCISSRLKARNSDYSVLDFAARRAIFSAIEADCTNELGNCLTAESKEVHCYLNRPPHQKAAAPEAEPKKEDKKKK